MRHEWLRVGLRCLISWTDGWSGSGCGSWVEQRWLGGTGEELGPLGHRRLWVITLTVLSLADTAITPSS